MVRRTEVHNQPGDPIDYFLELGFKIAGQTENEWLVTPTEIRMDRLRRREYARFGDRILPGGDMYEQHQAFLAWAAAYDDGAPTMRSRAMHDLWQQKLSCPLLTLDGARPVEELAEEVLQKI